MLAMALNDNAASLMPRVVLESIASMLAPAGDRHNASKVCALFTMPVFVH